MVEPATVVKVPPLVPVVIIPKPAFKVPAPVKIIEALLPVLSVVISPVTFKIPVEMVIWCLAEVPPEVNETLAAFNLPVPMAKTLLPLPDLGIVTAPVSVNVNPLKSKVVAVEVVNDTEAAAASAVNAVSYTHLTLPTILRV